MTAPAPATGSLTTTGPVLDVDGMSVRYRTPRGEVFAVTDASFSLSAGESVAIIGETGSGKSSVIRALLGLLPPTATVTAQRAEFGAGADRVSLLDAVALRRSGARGRALGFVPQSTRGALNPVQTIWAHFRSTYRAHGLRADAQARTRTVDLLSSVGFADPQRVLTQYPHQLSGGMAQRAVLALATCLDPQVLIADEPTSGLDASVKTQVMAQLGDQVRTRGRALLMVTHDVSVTAQHCDRVIVMYAGCVVESGPTLAVLRAPKHRYTQALLAAVPRPGVPPVSLPGSARPVTSELTRCAFWDRCPGPREDRCATERPPLQEVGNDRWVASFCD